MYYRFFISIQIAPALRGSFLPINPASIKMLIAAMLMGAAAATNVAVAGSPSSPGN
jgi:hypothetical protein